MDTHRDRTTRRLLVSFLDLAGFAREAERTDDATLAARLDGYYERIADTAALAGGTVVKFIGDGALVVFPPERGDDAVRALLDLRAALAETRAEWRVDLTVRLHACEVICGPFGGRADKRFDVIGQGVNLAARLPTRSFAISAEAFRTLSPAGRALFKKHTPPVTYIPVEDRRPTPMTKL